MLVNNKKFEDLQDRFEEQVAHNKLAHDYQYNYAKEAHDKNSNLESRLAAMETRLDGLDLLLQQLLTCFNVTHIPAIEAETIPGDYIIAHERIDQALLAGRAVAIKIGPKPAQIIVELKKKR